MNINELLDELQSASWDVGNARDHQIADATKAEAEARAAVDAEVKRMQDRIAELEKQKSYVYIGRDGKAVLARDLEDRLIAAEADNIQFRVNLSTRDYFIVSKDLWPEFTSKLPTKIEFEAMIADEIARRNLNKAKGVEE